MNEPALPTDDADSAPARGVVVAFPGRKTGSAAQVRLERAMAALAAASQEQTRAVAAWRQSLADLRAGVGKLTSSMSHYQQVTAETGARVGALGREARQLEATMDAILSRMPGARFPG